MTWRKDESKDQAAATEVVLHTILTLLFSVQHLGLDQELCQDFVVLPECSRLLGKGPQSGLGQDGDKSEVHLWE